jgi:hypothetical protein
VPRGPHWKIRLVVSAYGFGNKLDGYEHYPFICCKQHFSRLVKRCRSESTKDGHCEFVSHMLFFSMRGKQIPVSLRPVRGMSK